jgi:hypothetical protein
MPTLTSYFNGMDDPRGGNAPRHKFCDLMTISLLCALCGGETAVDMELFGEMKEDFLREFLELPHGIPCHDAYSRLFRLMKPSSFQTFFDKFRTDFAAANATYPAIAIDGKEMRRSFGKAAEQSNIPNAPGNPNFPLGYPFFFHHLIRKPVPTFRGDGVYEHCDRFCPWRTPYPGDRSKRKGRWRDFGPA